MKARKVSRCDWMIGTASTVAASAIPLREFPLAGEMQTPAPAEAVPPMHQPYLDSRAGWMQDSRYRWGVMTHYLADWQARDHNLVMTVDRWNKLVNGFDVEGMAKRLDSVGAGHYQLSIGQNSGYYHSPNLVCVTESRAFNRASVPVGISSLISTSHCANATSS